MKIGIPNKIQLINDTSRLKNDEIIEVEKQRPRTKEKQELKDKTLTLLKQQFNQTLKPLDITLYLINIKDSEGAEKINRQSELINYIDDNYHQYILDKNQASVFLYTYDKNLIAEVDAENIIKEIQQHQDYVAPENVKEKAYQNANSIKIQLIIQDWMNVTSAHIPINMDTIRGCIRQNNNKLTTLLNPAVIYEMQVENQVGKRVIGIAANGEKAFFTLYYYFTECYRKLRDNGSKELESMIRFNKTFNRIKGRWDADANGTLPQSVTKTHIANLNMKVCGMSDEDIEFEVDQMISQLLSAATDNAKELILAKINTNDTFAKIYFYGLILGFNINDLAAFMTSPAMNILAELSEQNMFDINYNKQDPEKIYNLLRYGKYPFFKWLGNSTNSILNNAVKKGLLVKLVDGSEQQVHSLNEWAMLKNKGLINETFANFIERIFDREYSIFTNIIEDHQKKRVQKIYLLSEYIEGTSKKIIKTLSAYNGDEKAYLADLNDFKLLWDLSNELTTFTNIFLNTNQGLPTTLDKYISKLLGILNTVKNREKAFTKYDLSGKVINSLDIALKSQNKVDALFDLFQNDNWTIYERNTAKSTLEEALKLKIVKEFSYLKWLTDKNYQRVTKEYYNLIKGTINIFHFLEVHPQFNSNFELMKCSYPMVKAPIMKMKLILAAQEAYEKDTDFWTLKNNKKLTLVIDNVLTKKFFKDIKLELKVQDNWKLLNEGWRLSTKHSNKLILDNGLGYSNFKYIFENYIVPNLKSGIFKGHTKTSEVNLQENHLIKNIELKVDHHRPYLGLNINLDERDVSAIVNIKYSELVQGFKELAEYKIPEISSKYTIQDLFVIYNILENKNRYGSDKLTGLFKDVLGKHDTKSILFKYLTELGETDYASDQINTDELLPLIEDIKMDLAPTISQYALQYHQEPYVKVKSHGLVIFYKKENTDGSYKPIRFIRNEYDELTAPNTEQSINYLQYSTLWSINEDAISLLAGRLNSSNVETIIETMLNLIANNKLLITTNC